MLLPLHKFQIFKYLTILFTFQIYYSPITLPYLLLWPHPQLQTRELGQLHAIYYYYYFFSVYYFSITFTVSIALAPYLQMRKLGQLQMQRWCWRLSMTCWVRWSLWWRTHQSLSQENCKTMERKGHRWSTGRWHGMWD